MIYKIKKRDDFGFDSKLKSYVYRGKSITADQAEKLRHKWALKDLMENAAQDSEITPLGLSVFEVIIKNISKRELTARNQAITYHAIKRYVECVSKFYDVTKRDESLPKVKRPHIAPKIPETDDPWRFAERVGAVLSYRGVAYSRDEDEAKVSKFITMSALYAHANHDEALAALANATGTPLFSEFVKVALSNNDLAGTLENVYDYLKHLIIIIDRYFDLKLDASSAINVGQSRLTGTMYYCLNPK